LNSLICDISKIFSHSIKLGMSFWVISKYFEKFLFSNNQFMKYSINLSVSPSEIRLSWVSHITSSSKSFSWIYIRSTSSIWSWL